MIQMPERDELVLATVRKIMPYGAFCTLDEYQGREAFIHISEVAPRWIKNIHEFLHEGQKLVAKVHNLIPEKNQIDLSLKRVTESEKKLKIEDSRRERRAEKLFEVSLKIAKSTKNEQLEARAVLTEKYGSLIDAIEALSEKGEQALEGIKIEKGLGKALLEVAAKNIKKTKAEVNGIISLTSYSADGVGAIQKIVSSAKTRQKAKMDILYLGAPKYQVRVIADDFKTAEKALDETAEAMLESAKKLKADAEFSKIEN